MTIAHQLVTLRGNICIFLGQLLVIKSTLNLNNQLEDAECVRINPLWLSGTMNNERLDTVCMYISLSVSDQAETRRCS